MWAGFRNFASLNHARSVRQQEYAGACFYCERCAIDRSRLNAETNVLRRVAGRIHAAAPMPVTRWPGGYLKRERLPVGIQDPVKYERPRREVHRGREAMRGIAPIRLPEPHPMPFDAARWLRSPRQTAPLRGCCAAPRAQRDEPTDEAVKAGGRPREPRPVEPGLLTLEAVPVVIAALRAPELIAHEKHRRPDRDQGDREKVLHLPGPQPLDGLVRGRPLHTTIPAEVLIAPVTIAGAVAFIVLAIV